MITRDAKIGLLVVLAFCLIVGILLSEHMTTTGETPQASLAQAGTHVRQATNAPTPIAPVAANATVIDADPQPKTPVTTRDTLDVPIPTTTSKIELGHASGGEMKVIRVDSAADAVAGAVQVAVPATSQLDTAPAKGSDAAAKTVTPTKASTALDALAKQHGLELVAVASNTQTSPKVGAISTMNLTAEPKSLAPIAKNTKVKEVVALAGDTLSKLAGRTLGSNTPQNRQAIVDLNPSLQKNSERILVGAKYLVPADAWAAALNVDSSSPTPTKVAIATPPDAKSAAKPSTDKPAVATIAYEVKSGDSLWKLAAGDATAVEQIKTLNADVLKGAETVKVGMKLKLPAKSKV